MKITRVITDNDWDGLSAGLQVLRHHPGLELVVDNTKNPSSGEGDLVLDLQTSGDGWVIDHHLRKEEPQRPLIYRPEGYPCTSRLVTEFLETQDWWDLFCSATAEITEGVPHPEHGYQSLVDLEHVAPWLFKEVPYISQHNRTELVYLLADLIAVSCQQNIDAVPRLVREFVHEGMTVGTFVSAAPSGLRERLWAYTRHMRTFQLPNMPEVQIGGRTFLLTPHDCDWAPFSPQTLDRIQLLLPGRQLIMFREAGLCVRTTDPEIIEICAERLGPLLGGFGGRGDRWALGCKRPLTPEDHHLIFDR